MTRFAVLTLSNEFHNTSVTVRADEHGHYKLSPYAAHKLCGLRTCTCGTVRGLALADGVRVRVEAGVDRHGKAYYTIVD